MLGSSGLVALPRYRINWLESQSLDASPSSVIVLLIEKCISILFGFFRLQSMSGGIKLYT